MKSHFKSSGYIINGCLNTDFTKITKDIIALRDGTDANYLKAAFRVADMVQARITAPDPEAMKEVYTKLTEMEDLKVLKIHDFDEGSNTILLNFAFDDVIIGEIQVNCSKRPVNFNANKALVEMA